MLKLISPIQRRRDLDLEAFSRHWRTTHREMALRLVAPGIMKGYMQNHRRPEQLDGLAPIGDGVPEVWVENVGEIVRLGTCPEYLEGAHLDEPNFMEGRASMVVAQTAVRVGTVSRKEAVPLVKLMLFFSNCGADLLTRWSDTEHSVLLPDARPLRLEREMAIAEPLPEGLSQSNDMVECSWWPDLDAVRNAWGMRARPPAEAVAVSGMLVREEPVFWPPDQYL